MFVLEALALGSLLVVGRGLLLRFPYRGEPDSGNPVLRDRDGVEEQNLNPGNPAPNRIGRDLRISTGALSLAVAGTVWRSPMLGLISLSGVFVVFLPTFGAALWTLRQRRVDTHVLDTVRLAVCAVMGYTIIAGLNALLHAWSQRLLLRSERDLSATLDDALGISKPSGWVECHGVEIEVSMTDIKPGEILRLRRGDTAPTEGCVVDGRAMVRPHLTLGETIEVRTGDRVAAGQRLESGTIALRVQAAALHLASPHGRLEAAATHHTPLRRIGENLGGRMAPWMLGAFALSTPLMGINRAASFLTTSFGAQMNRLGPYTARQFIGLAARYGILIREPKALELTNLVNTVIFDGRVLADPGVRTWAAGLVHALRQRAWPSAESLALPFAAYVMADTEAEGSALAEQVGLDGYFAVFSEDGRAVLIEGLQSSGRLVCYVAAQYHDAPALEAALLACAVQETGGLEDTPAHILLTDPSLRGLMGVFEMAPAFAAKQRRNLLLPIATDVIDISTTVFLHCGLIYSVLLSYSGFLASLARARIPNAMALTPPPATPPIEAGDRPVLTP